MAATGALALCLCVLLALSPAEGKERGRRKDIRDYNDADMARLLEQWEKDDDIEDGDLPEHKRAPPPVDFSKIDPSNPESILKMTKKGKTLMVFVTVSGNPTEKETEEITSLWQGSLFNANYDIQRFVGGGGGGLGRTYSLPNSYLTFSDASIQIYCSWVNATLPSAIFFSFLNIFVV
ncbi:hypothetical protein FKM82_004945 [Ascaphus truei]